MGSNDTLDVSDLGVPGTSGSRSGSTPLLRCLDLDLDPDLDLDLDLSVRLFCLADEPIILNDSFADIFLFFPDCFFVFFSLLLPKFDFKAAVVSFSRTGSLSKCKLELEDRRELLDGGLCGGL